MIMPQASLAFDTTSKNPLYTWVGFSEGWPGEEGMVNVLESIRVMAEWIMPICAVCPSIQIDSVQHAASSSFILHCAEYVDGMSIVDLLESIMDGLNPPTCSSCLVTKTYVFVIGVFKNHLLLQSSYCCCLKNTDSLLKLLLIEDLPNMMLK